jgi:hypothetical protein
MSTFLHADNTAIFHYSSHCTTPLISPADLTILKASNILYTLGGTISATAHDAINLDTAIQDLQAIVMPTLPPHAAALRVGVAPGSRVTATGTTPPPGDYDFGNKYIGDKHLKHLFTALQTKTYDIVEDWKEDLYCGISLSWNMTNATLT